MAEESLRTNITALSELVTNSVVIGRDRMQEIFDDSVKRGRMQRDDAEELMGTLLQRGQQQAEDVLSDIQQLLGKGREQLESAVDDARRAVGSTATTARKSGAGDRMLREVDRARRTAGLGPSFPIIGYDELTAGQVSDRLSALSPAELRKVRDYERRNANRKSVLGAIEKALA